MDHPDLAPAAARMATLVRGVADQQLTAPTPCTEYSVGDLLDHIGGLTRAFTMAATKDVPPPGEDSGALGDAARLGDGWRDRIGADLDRLVDAWREPEAWTGATTAGGIDLPGEIAGLVALEELVVHGWDLARATGQTYDPDPAALQVTLDLVGGWPDESRGGAYGPAVAVPGDTDLMERVVAVTGRRPDWAPPGG